MNAPFCLVVNPVAGGGRSLRAVPAVTAELDAAGARYDVTESALDFAGYAVVVANAAYFGAGMKVAPPARVDDGALDVVTMRHASKIAFGRVLLRIRNGSHVRLPPVALDRGTEVTLTAGRDLPAAADGETLAYAAPLPAGTPLRVRALPGALRALAPAPGLSQNPL
jgi:diacylglycerol kinase family enzyme